MDIQRKSEAKKRQVKRVITLGVGLLCLAGITVGLSRLKPAAKSIDRNSVWMDTVQRGAMVVEVRGAGTLVPVDIRWIPTVNAGRVDRILVLPGTAVTSEAVVVELSNPELEQAARDAEWALKAAEAELRNLKVQLESQRLNQEAMVASFKHDFTQADLEAQADEELERSGLIPKLVSKRSRAKADELKGRCEIEQKRLDICAEAASAQTGMQLAKVEQLKAQAELKRQQVRSLKVQAGMNGVLQKLGEKEALQVGQQLAPGANVARVADPLRLKAEVHVAETQAKDVVLGQPAKIDTRNGVAEGKVMRIDPAVQNGTVTVDVELAGTLPRGARPDLTVEGAILVEKLDDVIFVGRPVQAQADSTLGIYRVDAGGREAVRTSVRIGRSSINTVEVLGGLNPGDQVILSDMSRWDSHERIRLN